jgi:hypothetical protein
MYNDNTTSNIKRSWLKFTIPQLPEGAIISSANLRLQATNSSGATVNVKGSTNTSWTESTITWSNAPSYNSTVISNGKPSITAGPIDFDVTSYATASGTYTFVITQANAVQTDWSSKEGSTAPQLIIDYYVPSRTSPAAFQPTDDAYVYQGATSTNYGADSSLVNNNTSGSVKRSWLKFTIDNLPLHARITNATLRLHATNSSGVTANVKGSTNTTWSEDSLTWSNAPSYNSTAISNGNQSVTAGPIDFDVTSYATESGTYTFVITQASTTETTWSSKEGSTSPELIITFTTIPDYGHDTVIAAVGDIACDPSDPNYNNGLGQNGECRQAAVADVVTDINPDRLLLLGDIQYNCGGLSAYEDVFDASWGQFLPITSPISGNHERNATNGTDCDATSKAYGYRHYFQDAYHPPPIGANAGLWYSFDLPDNWHVVALDSDCSRSPNPCLSTGPQLAWLHEDLQEATASGKHVMAFWHHPRFSQGTHFDDDRQGVWWDALYSAGADLILNGHAHNYQEFGPVDPTGAADATNGIRQFIVGTGGKDTQGASNSTPSAATSSLIQKETTTHGALKLILHANSYEWQYIAVDGDTTNMASGSANTKATY